MFSLVRLICEHMRAWPACFYKIIDLRGCAAKCPTAWMFCISGICVFVGEITHLDSVFSAPLGKNSLQGWLLGSYPPVETGSGLSLVTSLWEARQRGRLFSSQALETRYFCEYDFSSKSWKFSAFQVELLYFETVIPSPLSIVGMDELPNQLEQIFGIDHSKKISYTVGFRHSWTRLFCRIFLARFT